MPNYRDDFYKKENIIGYTGSLTNNPTVYFKDGDEFGRITQNHGNPNNIGRNKVRSYSDYRINNTGKNGAAQEYYNGKIRHSSRNPFISVSDDSRDELAQSIARFTEIKPKYK